MFIIGLALVDHKFSMPFPTSTKKSYVQFFHKLLTLFILTQNRNRTFLQTQKLAVTQQKTDTQHYSLVSIYHIKWTHSRPTILYVVHTVQISVKQATIVVNAVKQITYDSVLSVSTSRTQRIKTKLHLFKINQTKIVHVAMPLSTCYMVFRLLTV